MSQRDDDAIGHVPKITPSHDEIASYQRSKAKGGLVSSLGEVPDAQGSGGSTSKMLLTMVGLLLLVTVAWAGYLHLQLQATERSLSNYELRVADLEQRLEVTDESMSESGVATKVKIRELDSEIRKLWDNVWKKSKKQLAEHDALLKKHTQSIAGSEQFIKNTRQMLSENEIVIAGLTEQLKKVQQLQSQVAANQKTLQQQTGSLESAVDKTNKVSASVNKLDRRVKSTEEWVESINGFRRQVNRDMDSLKQQVGQLQGATP